mmetsp:Transcript_94800/g.263681  ORF Transcript_94800/g.263681 Transcript_94800/m.263681 type:complete len:206 (+) Transcript_94800:60-677(+)
MEFADAYSNGPVVFMSKSRAADRNAGRKRRVTVLRNSAATCSSATKGCCCCCSLSASSTAMIACKKTGRTCATSAKSNVAAWKISAPGPEAPPRPAGSKAPAVEFRRAGSPLSSMVRRSPVTALSCAIARCPSAGAGAVCSAKAATSVPGRGVMPGRGVVPGRGAALAAWRPPRRAGASCEPAETTKAARQNTRLSMESCMAMWI